MNKQEAIDALKNFLDWFEDNHGDESWFCSDPTKANIEYEAQNRGVSVKEIEHEVDINDGMWLGYLDLPEYTKMCEALKFLEND